MQELEDNSVLLRLAHLYEVKPLYTLGQAYATLLLLVMTKKLFLINH